MDCCSIEEESEVEDEEIVEGNIEKSNKVIIFLALNLAFLFLLAPFVFPIFTKLLILAKVFYSIEEITLYMSMFQNSYMLSIILFFIILLLILLVNKDKILDYLAYVKIKYSKNGNDIELGLDNEERRKNEKYKKMITKTQVSASKQEMKLISEGSIASEEKELEQSKIDLKQVQLERDAIRYFAAYNITNKFSRKLLIKINKEIRMEVSSFRKCLEDDYRKKVKGLYGKKLDEYVSNKVEDVMFEFKYLDIIEYSDDDKFILITDNGKKFIETYIEGVE